MAPHSDVDDDDLPSIDPYEVLGLEKSASADAVKSAYRKLALRTHPDKAPEDQKEAANTKFQAIAFAYAVLSDPTRRQRYDTTGSTAESVVDSEGFSWSDFYREQFEDAISAGTIEKVAKEYKGSEEEKQDVLNAFTACEGAMKLLYEEVMLSDPREDEPRFREIIDAAIKTGEVTAYKAYTKESAKARAARMKAVDEEADEAVQHAKDIGVYDQLFGDKTKKKSKADGDDALKALIQQRQQGRSSFLDQLEAKYSAKSKGKSGKKRKTPDLEEPSEEAFQAAAARLKNGNDSKRRSKKTRT